jgi:hypothetical protein
MNTTRQTSGTRRRFPARGVHAPAIVAAASRRRDRGGEAPEPEGAQTTMTTPTASTTVTVDELVAIVEKVGGAVTATEIAYQLRRRGHASTAAEIADALHEAEAQGLLAPHAWTISTGAPR